MKIEGLELVVLDEDDPAEVSGQVGRMSPAAAREILDELDAELAELSRRRCVAEQRAGAVPPALDPVTVHAHRQRVLGWADTAGKQADAIDQLTPWRNLVAEALSEYLARREAR